MSDDRAFINSLLAAPDDMAPWLVYADWLDERGDARGEYIRLVQSLATRPDEATRRRLNAVRPMLPREWLAVVEQPKLLRANPTPYGAWWLNSPMWEELPTVAEQGYQALPPVPSRWISHFDAWLFEHTDDGTERNRSGHIADLVATAEHLGLELPVAVYRFFRDDRLPRLGRHLTGAFFYLFDRPIPAPGTADAYLIGFLTDTRPNITWSLYLTPAGDSCVVVSPVALADWPDPETAACSFCAPSFEEFVIRTWLEYMGWFAMHAEAAGPYERRWAEAPEVLAYLDHYLS
jgi:uncharacterized protein (TIGR02996 family)